VHQPDEAFRLLVESVNDYAIFMLDPDELHLRQRQALEVNDDIIQGLAVADLALNLEDYDKAREVISSTLHAARRFVTDLLGQAGDAIPIAPGDLRRGERQTGS
jgi:hypothetical protein